MELLVENWDKTKFATNKDIVSMLAKFKPKASFNPGDKFEYSNTGYALLGLIIEKTSNMSFGKFLTKNIFHPLSMKNTLVYQSRFAPQNIDHYALGYVTDSLGNKVLLNSLGKEFYTYYLDGIVGDGMVNSTAEDLLKWDRALYTNQLVNDSDRTQIFASVKTSDGKETNYGFGWGIGTVKKYGKIANHSGGWAGYVTFIERHLDNDKTIIMLQNNSTVNTATPIAAVRKILYDEPLINETLKEAAYSATELDKYVGVYSSPDFPLNIKIFRADKVLMAQADGQGAFPLVAYENQTFKFDQAQIKLIFKEGEMHFSQGNSKYKFKRAE